MASYIQGYDGERFVTTVNQNFQCLICLNVLRDPVMCSRNQHCFCRSCITRHLQNAQRCPTCNDKLTVRTLTEPPRMVKNLINELNIYCVYNNRGCQEIVQLQHLDRHEDSCGFTPAACTNEGCGVTVNKRDLIHHESEQCEYRKLKCHSCGEMTITLANMEKRIANIETKIENRESKIKKSVAGIKTDMQERLVAVDNEVKLLKTVLVERLDQINDALVEIENRITGDTDCSRSRSRSRSRRRSRSHQLTRSVSRSLSRSRSLSPSRSNRWSDYLPRSSFRSRSRSLSRSPYRARFSSWSQSPS